jgi:hypothetical protein
MQEADLQSDGVSGAFMKAMSTLLTVSMSPSAVPTAACSAAGMKLMAGYAEKLMGAGRMNKNIEL